MRNITIAVSDAAYHQARIWAAERDTNISAVVRQLLVILPGITRANSFFQPRSAKFANPSNPIPAANPPTPA